MARMRSLPIANGKQVLRLWACAPRASSEKPCLLIQANARADSERSVPTLGESVLVSSKETSVPSSGGGVLADSPVTALDRIGKGKAQALEALNINECAVARIRHSSARFLFVASSGVGGHKTRHAAAGWLRVTRAKPVHVCSRMLSALA